MSRLVVDAQLPIARVALYMRDCEYVNPRWLVAENDLERKPFERVATQASCDSCATMRRGGKLVEGTLEGDCKVARGFRTPNCIPID